MIIIIEAIGHTLLLVLAVGHIMGGMATKDSGFSVAGAILLLAFVLLNKRLGSNQE